MHHESLQPGSALTAFVAAAPTLDEVLRVLTLRAGYNTTVVLLAAAALGIAGGLVGAFLLLRGRALLADGLSHAALPGVCAAFLLAPLAGVEGRSVPWLLLGAACTSVLGVLTIRAILRHTRLHEDAAIGAVLSVFFGAGVVLLSVIQTLPGGAQGGLSHFIFGQTAAMSIGDATLMASIAAASAVAVFVLFKELALVCFNEGFGRAQGLRTGLVDLLLMALVVMVTIAGLQAVGIVLVVAVLIVPAAAARFWSDRLHVCVLLSGAIGGAGGFLGGAVSALLPRKPAGAVIVLTMGAVFAFSLLLAPRRGVLSDLLRRARQRARIAGDHLLEEMHEARTAASGVPFDALAFARRSGRGAMRTGLLVRVLRARGLVRGTPGALVPTEQGETEGARIARNHRLWARYLVTHAEVAPSHVDWSVDQIEHVLSPQQVAELEVLELEAIDRRPAGRLEGGTA